ncbi:hypothetical protein BDB01DRAFT_778400 [Pilobolus umbonatus]|nr:hypothetical protein BDB01DRAFT_778400 [Pilobolus umbonatus]
MNPLLLPNELIEIFSNYLTRDTMAQLCLTSKLGYQIFLPRLYSRLKLGYRASTMQLCHGIANNSFLKQTIKNNTRSLTLTCKQGAASHWILLSRLGELPHVQEVHFEDYPALPVTKVKEVLMRLPQVESLDIHYCELTSDDRFKKESSLSLKKLALTWTDFSAKSIQHLYSLVPNVRHVTLGSNHNKIHMANDSAILHLKTHCQRVSHLSISLQEIKQSLVCNLIQFYNRQLQCLSARCEGNNMLRVISQHATQLKKLVVRCNYEGYNNIIPILQQCQVLSHFEMVNWSLHDVPLIVLNQIKYKHKSADTCTETITETVTLNGIGLQEIRKLYTGFN